LSGSHAMSPVATTTCSPGSRGGTVVGGAVTVVTLGPRTRGRTSCFVLSVAQDDSSVKRTALMTMEREKRRID
jgi:hypothetical protein